MKWRKNKNKVKIIIDFDREKEDMDIEVKPEATRAVELIQILMSAIDLINEILQEEIQKKETPSEKKAKLSYIG